MKSCALQTPDLAAIPFACTIGVLNISWAATEYERDINAGDCDPSGRGAGLTAGSTSITRIEIVSLVTVANDLEAAELLGEVPSRWGLDFIEAVSRIIGISLWSDGVAVDMSRDPQDEV